MIKSSLRRSAVVVHKSRGVGEVNLLFHASSYVHKASILSNRTPAGPPEIEYARYVASKDHAAAMVTWRTLPGFQR